MTLTPADLEQHLAERIRPADEQVLPVAGEFVLYWMHHAVRSEENPALDTAIVTARRLELPLLVYQGLGGTHPYDSDRHHTFILEGARNVAAALAQRDVRHVFHLGTLRAQPSPLRDLAQRAALVVTEDFPAPPFPAWTRALASRITAPVWLVDTTCILPMRLVDRAYARAFEFRHAHGDALLHRARAAWPETEAIAKVFEGPLGFKPLDLAHADLPALCATCEIDHAVGPVPLTRGGSAAALSRWASFIDHGISSYDHLRNDAAIVPPSGVSRISPYLHYGHLSPFRVAREAAAHESRGAEKFLDELLIWRELSHNFCFQNEHLPGGLASLERLPQWARDTLQAHADDSRQMTCDWEQLARGDTGDALWDAAQRCLLIHGELHNNLRMTWGKAILHWTRNPQRALQLMVDLNHRYALDGSDPNSYGGILYCLGLFDRPFSPEQPVSGRIRSRPTRQHAQRLNLPAYRARCNSRGLHTLQQVAVIGAGIAGLAAARTLRDQGFQIRVFERGRGVGGRTAHRRLSSHSFDHGAQYFTAKDTRFARYVEAWEQAGLVAPWQGRIVAIGADGAVSPVTPVERYVGVPGMNAIAKHLARDIDVTCGCTITSLHRDAASWAVQSETGETFGPFDALVVALPPEQLDRLTTTPDVSLDAEMRVDLTPCWCAMVAFDAPLPVDIDGAFVNDAVIDWIARDSSKPGRPTGERWVIHANASWSAAHLADSPEACAHTLLARFFNILGLAPQTPAHLAGHRWSFARAAQDKDAGCLWCEEMALALCGDWCFGGRVEGAFLSGIAAAARVASAAVQCDSTTLG